MMFTMFINGRLIPVVLFAAIAAYGQGSVAFDNGFPTGNAIKLLPSDVPVPASGIPGSGIVHVELFAGPAGVVTEAQLTTGLLDSPTSMTPVRILADIQVDGYFFGPTAYVQGIAGANEATFQVRAWSGSSASYAAALIAPGALVGKSPLFQVILGGVGSPPSLPASLRMPPFAMGATVPEPSAIVLGVLGVAALLFRRRK